MKKLIIVVIIIALAAFFWPKAGSQGDSTGQGPDINCNCFGYEKQSYQIGGGHNTCYGIVYNCQES